MRLQTYNVQGPGLFPVEMLFAEEAFPATREAAEMIGRLSNQTTSYPVTICLKRWVSRKGDRPLWRRWESHGWQVLESQTR